MHIDVYPTAEELGENRTPNECPKCSQTFANRGALRMHSVKHHRTVENNGDRQLLHRNIRVAESSTPRRFHCPQEECAKVFSDRKKLTQHFQKVHGPKRYQCVECSADFSLERDLRYHSTRLCPSLGDSRPPIRRSTKSSKTPKSSAETQTIPPRQIIVVLHSAKRPANADASIQTEAAANPFDDYMGMGMEEPQGEMSVQTNDFGVQYGESNFPNVPTFDQSTMYEYTTEPVYYQPPPLPQMVDASTYAPHSQSSQEYETSAQFGADFANRTTQTTFSEAVDDDSLWMQMFDSPQQTHSATQTPAPSWFQYPAAETYRDNGSMTEPGYFG